MSILKKIKLTKEELDKMNKGNDAIRDTLAAVPTSSSSQVGAPEQGGWIGQMIAANRKGS